MVRAAMGIRKARRIAISLAGLALVVGAAVVGYASVTDSPMPEPPETDWAALAAGPTDELDVYWVGHSLFNHRDPTVEGAPNLMEEVGRLAEARGLEYGAFDHTLYGITLSLAVRGKAHTYGREETELASRMEELRTNGAAYDALVLTEGIPIDNAEEPEHSAYYAMRLYCTLKRSNPDGRVYLYEGPLHLQASDPVGGFGPRDEFGWAASIEGDRPVWERIADRAATGDVPTPGLGPRLRAILGKARENGCEPSGPIFLIPAATVYVHLAERMAEPGPGDVFELSGGERLTIEHLFQNPYVDWPEDWPLPPHEGPDVDEESVIEGLTKRHPEDDYDDVHPSRIGNYVSGLVAYAVLYRRSPVLDPAVPSEDPDASAPSDPGAAIVAADAEATGLSPATVRTLRRLVWDVVRTDPRTGIDG
jgi:hypothetical protein